MSYLTIENLNLELGGKMILTDLNLSIEKGQLISLLGPSGCGKSTLLRGISGLNSIKSGKVMIDGQDITKLAPKKREVGMVFQSYALFPNLTVADNVAFGLAMKRVKKDAVNKKVAQILELVGLEDKAKSYPSELSGGQQQRVALARSIVVEPKVLLLDEPLSALDAQIRRQLRLELCRLQRKLGITMIFVTHDQEEAMTISDRIFVMHKGKIAQEGTPSEVYFHPQNEFVAGFIGNYNKLNKMQVEQLFGSLDKDGSTYVLRPEAIDFTPQAHAVSVVGQIIERHILGNVVRCTVQTQHGTLWVDRINQGQAELDESKDVTLFIRQEDVVTLHQ
ncbi:ABC transporter ATP-binding protein [Sporolactobacillus shoreicorticis]|uniref:ABC transporter ATP-binding protein n=1 Tax=Sporolactobacillus shoreicorticis TaxID=1923877 RepID=A0ABW5S225_9BACL|nr:ABC transporter ATP-binding protein [Sporolactobacillus shoreicorticis]MCO7125372.1 ABC transporter ATP-binding protein [Sporolactobacillus shoreicorticis]